MNIQDAKVIITGGSSGIGYETAKVLADQGAQVIVSGRDKNKLKTASEELGVLSFQADMSNEEEIKALFDFAIKQMGKINVLINNAGAGWFAPLIETSVEDLQKQWEVNTRGLFIAGREAAKHFVSKKYGNIINIGSTAAIKGFASGSAYVASKFAVSGLTECWRAELRPHNVRVMQVNPSEVVTNFFNRAGHERPDTEHKLKPSEIAHLISAMLSMNDIGFIPDASVWATNPWGK